MRAILLYRRDLRIHDHEGLFFALSNNYSVLPVFIWNEAWKKESWYGLNRLGSFREVFLRQSLQDLKKRLFDRGLPLWIAEGDPVELVLKLIQDAQITTLILPTAYTAEDFDFIQQIRLHTKSNNLAIHQFATESLMSPSIYRNNPQEQFPDYVHFRLKFEKQLKAQPPTPIPPGAFKGFEFSIPSFELNISPKLKRHPILVGGTEQGRNRIEDYIWKNKKILNYKLNHQGLFNFDDTSKLSAHLGLGCISAKELFWELRNFQIQNGESESVDWFRTNLIWREYYKYRSLFRSNFGLHSEGVKKGRSTAPSAEEKKNFIKWATAEIGIDFLDACMSELRETGFISFRLREILAHQLCLTWNMDWRWGAELFEHYLIDHDDCTNFESWSELSEAGNHDKKQPQYREIAASYDPLGKYVQKWKSN